MEGKRSEASLWKWGCCGADGFGFGTRRNMNWILEANKKMTCISHRSFFFCFLCLDSFSVSPFAHPFLFPIR
jgi:hypothetical protein